MKKFADGSAIEFGRGKFDDWCVYVTRPGVTRYAPRDTDYFAKLVKMHHLHPRLYDDFLAVYTVTTKIVTSEVLADITARSLNYPPTLQVEVDLLLTILYAAMTAEEMRAGTRLGKRIKRLGIHQILIESMPVADAANFSRGMPWQEIDALCRERGF